MNKTLTFIEYVPLALLTESMAFSDHELWDEYRKEHSWMGVVTEIGELVDAFKKEKFYGVELDVPNVLEEIGDIAWYLALGYDAFGCDEVFLLDKFYIENESTTLGYLVNAGFEYAVAKTPEHAKQWINVMLSLMDNFAKDYGVTLETILYNNIKKLKTRYPDKFKKVDAINRDLEAERDIVENVV